MRANLTAALAALFLIAGCGDSTSFVYDVGDLDVSTDGSAGTDAGSGDTDRDGGGEDDAGTDVERDAAGDTPENDLDAAPDAAPDTAPSCADNLDCAGGEVCRDGFCVEACLNAADCDGADRPVCTEDGVCVACVVNDDCGAGLRCDTNNTCVFACASDIECAGGQVCDETTGECRTIECLHAGDCDVTETCVLGVCVPDPAVICEPSTQRCDGDDVVHCSEDGRSEETAACQSDAPCLAGDDDTAACEPLLCVPDAISCVDINTAALCETGGRSVLEIECRDTQICVDGVCIVPECEPATTTCSGDLVVECSATGDVVSERPCALEPACVANPAGCACTDGACVERVCVPGAGRCVANSAQICAADGMSWGALADCGAEFCVEGECRAQFCTPSTQECRGDVRVVCSTDGLNTTETDCTATSRICTETGATAACGPRVCVPSTNVCNGGANGVLTCDTRGAAFTETPCGAGTYCTGGACVPQVCEPGAGNECVGGDVQRCNALGSGYTMVADCGTATCTAGVCDSPCAGLPAGHLGCEFWAADLHNFAEPCTTTCSVGTCLSGYCTSSPGGAPTGLLISNPGPDLATVTVRVGGASGSLAAAGDVAAGASQIFTLASRSLVDTSVGSGWLVSSSRPVLAGQFNPLAVINMFSNDASLLWPTQTLGTSYRVASWPTMDTADGFVSQLAVVATQPGVTRLTIRPTAQTLAGGSVGSFAAGVAQTVDLTQGQALSLASAVAGGDLTGTQIDSTQPVAVFGGNECANVPTDVNFCDHVEEQMLPVSRWGRRYVLAQSPPRGLEPDRYSVMASVAGTVLHTIPVVSGVDGVTLGAGESLDFWAYNDMAIYATQPIAVTQFLVGTEFPEEIGGLCDRADIFGFSACAIDESASCATGALGDPAMGMVIPVTDFATSTTFRIPAGWVEAYAVVTSRSTATVQVNGTPTTATPSNVTLDDGATWSVRRIALTESTTRISTTNVDGVGVMLIGYACGASFMLPASAAF